MRVEGSRFLKRPCLSSRIECERDERWSMWTFPFLKSRVEVLLAGRNLVSEGL